MTLWGWGGLKRGTILGVCFVNPPGEPNGLGEFMGAGSREGRAHGFTTVSGRASAGVPESGVTHGVI